MFVKCVGIPSKLVKGFIITTSAEDQTAAHRRSVKKIEAATACTIKVADDGSETLFTISSEESDQVCAQARAYLDYSIQAWKGQKVSIEAVDEANCLIHFVASSVFSPIISRNSAFIRSLEEELGVLCFACDDKEASLSGWRKNPALVTPEGMGAMVVTDGEILTKKQIHSSVPIAILGGTLRNRIAFKFKLMHMMESKLPGVYTQLLNGVDLCQTAQFHYNCPSVCVDTFPVAETELSLANGRMGLNRRRISHVSGCVVEYIGACAFFYGDLQERQLARTLLTIILERGRGNFQVSRWKSAVGVLVVECGPEHVAWLTHKQGLGFQQVEQTAPVLCFMETLNTAVSSTTKSALPAPLPRASGSDLCLSVRSEQQRHAIVVLGSDEHLKTALKFISERINPGNPPDETQDTASMFHKLFRGKGYKPVLAEEPANGNKLHRAIVECMQLFGSTNFINTPCVMPDLTVLEVPLNFQNACNNISALLRQMEDEYGVSCAFIQPAAVVIVGALRPRRAAELKMMAAVESKIKGFYSFRIVRENKRVCDLAWTVPTEDFDTDSVPIPADELSFALGNKGYMRKKLALASGCIIEYVGEVAFFSGTLVERSKGKDYLKWVLRQLDGEVAIPDFEKRPDVAFVPLNRRMAGYVNGNKGRLLRATEELTGTFCFVGKSVSSAAETKPLIICGLDEGREAAFYALSKYLEEHQNSTWQEEGEKASSETGLKAELGSILAKKGIKIKPLEPWKIGSNAPCSYVYISQPCPGAARKDAVNIASPSEKTGILRQSTNKKDRNVASPASSEFVNDSTAFPDLLGSRKSSSFVKSVFSPEPESSSESPSPPPPPPVTEAVTTITIDREKGEIWGDWGLGPDGDPTVVRTVDAPKLLGAWK